MIMSCSSMGGSQFVLLCVKMFETALFDSFQTLDVDGVYRTHELVTLSHPASNKSILEHLIQTCFRIGNREAYNRQRSAP